MSAKKISFAAIMAAFSFVFLYIASLLPTAKIALYAVATVFLAGVVIEHGIKPAFVCYLAVSLLSFLLIPNKLFCLPYIFFFGYYPIFKSFCEKKVKNKIACYGVKLLGGNIAFGLLLILMKLFFTDAFTQLTIIPLWLISNLVFLIYDIVFSGMIAFYMRNIHSKISFH